MPGSIHIALTGQYASWAARILGLDTPLIIVGEDPEHVRESQLRLARVGVENVAGYLADGVAGWIKSGLELDYDSADHGSGFRRTTEPGAGPGRRAGRARSSENGPAERSRNRCAIPLGKLKSRTAELDREKLLVVHCKGGYRSSIATSILRRAGFRDIANLIGGFDAWKAAGLPFTVPGIAGA